jgi:hypothetical protein
MPSCRTAQIVVACLCGAVIVQAADLTQARAEAFARKVTLVAIQGVLTTESVDASPSLEPRRTAFTEAELNSFFAYRGQDLLPEGVSDARVTILDEGRVRGTATVDLEAMGKAAATGGTFNPWSYLSGRVPVTVSGVLHTADGVGRFELESAVVSGVPVPRPLVRDLVAYYSRAADTPDGVRLDGPFPLPASIRRIEVAQGQAVVIQ